MPPLLFWAQSLDNVAPDHFAEGDALIAEGHAGRRQRVVNRVAAAGASGTLAYEGEFVTVTVGEDEFVVEVISAERDVGDRLAPVICFGEFPEAPADAWPREVAAAVSAFMQRIGREPTPDRIDEVAAGLEAALAKKARAAMRRRLLVGAAFGVGVVVLWVWLRA